MKRMAVQLLAGAMFLTGMATVAHASPLTLTITSGSDSLVVQDNITYATPPAGYASDLDTSVGSLGLFSNYVNGIKVSNVTSSEALDPLLGTFDIGSYILKGVGTIKFDLNETGITLATLPFLFPNIVVTQAISGSQSGTASIISTDFLVNGVSVPGAATTLAAGTSAGSSRGTTYVMNGGPFSIDEIITVNLGDATSTVSLDGISTVAPVPEPGTMMLLGAGFLGLAVFSKRRKNA